jgi:hypothetical protein
VKTSMAPAAEATLAIVDRRRRKTSGMHKAHQDRARSPLVWSADVCVRAISPCVYQTECRSHLRPTPKLLSIENVTWRSAAVS